MQETHKEKFREMIIDTLGSNYTLHAIEETSKYVFGFWKHVDYEHDDERGMLVGPGPVVFIKESKEYKNLGSGDLVYGDYYDEFREEENDDDGWLSVTEIKEGILRRKFVNEHDIVNMIFKMNQEFGEYKYELDHVNWRKPRETFVFISDHVQVQEKIKLFLEDLKIAYTIEGSKIIFNRELE
ncbi:hypothetical protein ATO12_02915 [Aquimarina atlantica]|uniref:Uncharacterized protein n=1 Tax=Aquimarina atlantica TaxID=1317122 RepID=A0A023C0B6_9FLAO|nr:hypothetical protein [Aquimarina atlantica]EZH75756.1 hypothetical protein ATO12_02915 [Aquimarina atlantica]